MSDSPTQPPQSRSVTPPAVLPEQAISNLSLGVTRPAVSHLPGPRWLDSQHGSSSPLSASTSSRATNASDDLPTGPVRYIEAYTPDRRPRSPRTPAAPVAGVTLTGSPGPPSPSPSAVPAFASSLVPLGPDAPPRDLSGWYGFDSGTKCLASSISDDCRVMYDGMRVPARLLSPTSGVLAGVWVRSIVPAVIAASDRLGLVLSTVDLARVARPHGLEAETDIADSAAVQVVWVGVRDSPGACHLASQLVEEVASFVRDLGLVDLHVEVHTCVVQLLAAPSLLLDDPESSARTEEICLSRGIGLDIARASQETVRSTGGMYLRLGDLPGLYMLMAQHCVASSAESQRQPSEVEPGENIFLFCPLALRKRIMAIDEASTVARVAERGPLSRLVKGRALETDERKLEEVTAQLDRLAKLKRKLASDLAEVEDRILGQVWAYPSIRLNVRDQSVDSPIEEVGFTEDWCLIELDPAVFGGDLTEINSILLPALAALEYAPDPLPDDLRLPVQGFLPLREMSERSTKVLKRGAASDLTFGWASPIRSFIRRNGRADSATWEIPIFPKVPLKQFLAGGDSGSTVVDLGGRLIGMGTGGHANDLPLEKGVDISYASPWEFLFQRIAAFTGHEPRLA
ncbi:uncharacterized protein MKK02DRAFT_37791 [Dioszegia hungarica]|uniref:Uncharacterized protein n=1 Tax=Dioszegia hungarica TaxID=4972 RepID=A0AA38H675_9TREE|nr:uncharacterized protein MKK02DRAFT_37791 [Dioszegia hungarica]KAI9634915.1 hypothetical protein MKK02DRAFT_37791 [Dioszegia hungarica]